MQRVELIGRIGKDTILRMTTSNKKICDTSIAVNERYGDKELTTWFNVRAWNETAEILNKYSKGDEVLIIGKIRNDKYTASDGQERYWSYLNIDYLKKLETAKKEEEFADIKIEESELPFY